MKNEKWQMNEMRRLVAHLIFHFSFCTFHFLFFIFFHLLRARYVVSAALNGSDSIIRW